MNDTGHQLRTMWMIPLLLWGCSGRDGLQRVEVRGAVTLDGAPLKEGSITFFPVGEGPVVGAFIENGTFHVPRASGPAAGEYRVEIDSSAPNGVKVPDFGGNLVEQVTSIIPAQYNRQSTLRMVLQPSGPNQHDFHLAREPSPKK